MLVQEYNTNINILWKMEYEVGQVESLEALPWVCGATA